MSDPEWRDQLIRDIEQRPRAADVHQWLRESERRALAHCDGNRQSTEHNTHVALAKQEGALEALRAVVYGEDGVNGLGADVRDTKRVVGELRRLLLWMVTLAAGLVLAGLSSLIFGIVEIRLNLP